MVFTTQLKHFKKSGARLYIKQDLLNSPDFPFEDDEILKVEIVDGRLMLSKPEWWEVLDWDQMPQVWRTLPDEIKAQIRAAGLAPNSMD
ncbi:hypothetical protein JXL21_05345 [Candidatus Bathyarchaeota archaeon]|nr:hypothetical protein [Candidatus Bathyarchaeota archaeon]